MIRLHSTIPRVSGSIGLRVTARCFGFSDCYFRFIGDGR